MPNLRYTARGRPQIRHRRSWRLEYLGVRSALAIFDLLAMQFGPLVLSAPTGAGAGGLLHRSPLHAARSGIPSFLNKTRASSSLFVLVTSVTFIPWGLEYLSGFNSGKTNCSVRPRL